MKAFTERLSMLRFLVYHRIADNRQGDFRAIHPDAFCRHLERIEAAGVPVIDPGDLALPADPLSGIVLTFDDATMDHFSTARSILSDFGFPGLFYVPTARLDSEGYLSTEQLVRLHAEGHTIGSHSHTHARLDVLPEPSVRHELETSRWRIQEILGEAPLHFAPPGGLYRERVLTIAQEVGFRFFRTTKWGFNRRLDPQEIRVVPMVTPSSMLFLNWALSGRNELTLEVMYGLKRALRDVRARVGFDSFVLKRAKMRT
jgi:peptidoglycan/xylan/chitin deacetylase (PgdA/CDA1 family)